MKRCSSFGQEAVNASTMDNVQPVMDPIKIVKNSEAVMGAFTSLFHTVENRRSWIAAPLRAMKTLCWNCRGLGSPRVVRNIKDVIGSCCPEIVGLIETKYREEELKN